MSRVTRDWTTETVSRDQILRRERGQKNIHFPCSADTLPGWSLLLRYVAIRTYMPASQQPHALVINRLCPLSFCLFLATLGMSLFPSIMYHCRFIFGWRVSCTFTFRMFFFLPCGNGLDFGISLCEISTNLLTCKIKLRDKSPVS